MIQKKQYWFNGAWYNEEDALKIIDSPKVIDILFHDYEKRMKKLPKAKFGFDPNISEENYQLLLKTIIGRGNLIINKIYKVYDTIESYYKLQGILKGIEAINKDDFMFLDPPYDCIFNDYGNIEMAEGFNEDEHRRLAQDFRNLSCKALMVIGRTKLTEELYGEFIRDEYFKSYAVNIRNRFKSDSKHIVVMNYQEED